ncbi:sigma-70 family RNA polymerase sigma factor [Roseateles saccharophilus]|uniref:sigma-70 family RNA polymerase sigma factor n=1 Tax=Roseateles saccharophilus TaxID=304 RepID=UPI00286B5035|nr:sigma-70 family RNA polymerase sigma factor [Roseateles saccharophilus]
MAGTSSPDHSSAPSTERAAAWAQRQSPAERASLVDAYTPLVRRLAARVYGRRFGADLDYTDLVQMGMVGLLEAIDRYTPARGVRFETFATHRIEGALLNGLPAYSELQRQLAVRRELVRERAKSLQEPTPQDKPALERLAELAISLALGFALEDSGLAQAEEPAEPDNAYARMELAQLRRRLAELTERLPEAERRVVFRHYFQQQPFDEIAASMNLTKGRISQLHHAALRRLRQRLIELKTLSGDG